MKMILNKLKPIFQEDMDEWKELSSEISLTEDFNIMWYGGSNFDLQPIMDIEKGETPLEISQRFKKNPLYIMSDYTKGIVNIIKSIYENFDKDNFDYKNYIEFYNYSNTEILQMIPLKFFDDNELKNIREKYTDYHRSVTSSVIPDNEWHFCYILLEKDNETVNIIAGFIENLVLWEEIFKKYNIPIDVFCALQMGGKSGSWDKTHSPSEGKLFKAIQNSDPKIRPKYWIADECYELREHWTEINPHERGFYGQQHFFRTELFS